MLSRLIAFAATAFIAVVVGPEAFGILGFALAVAAYAMVFVDAGFVDVGAREVARDPGAAAELALSVTVVRALVGAALVTLIAVCSPLLRSDGEGRVVLVLTALLVLTAALDPAWVFKGLAQGRPVARSLVGRRLAFAALVFLVVRGPEDVTLVPSVQVVGEILGIALLAWILPGLRGVRVDLARGWKTFRSSFALIATKVFRTSIITFDVILLGFLATDRDVGLYSAPYRLCFFLMALAGAIQVAYLPDVARTVDDEGRREAAARHLEVSAALGIPLAVGGILVAGPLMEALFGAAYRDAVPALQILLASLGVLFLFAPLHNVLLAQHRLGVENWSMGAAAVTNVILNLLWIPRYGLVGAATATLVAELMILFACGAAVFATMRHALLVPLVRPAVASLLMALALLPLHDGPAPIVVGVGGVVYAIALSALGGLPRDVMSALSPGAAQATDG